MLLEEVLSLDLDRLTCVISDTHVKCHYGKLLEDRFPKAHFFYIKPGEKTKNFSEVQRLLEKLLELPCDRSMQIVGIGGGVILDLAGFIASILLRGVDYISIPTTFLAMVDASIGGKTGVNTSKGKNLIGSFYPAEKIIVEPKFLLSLSKDELQSGFVEAVKHALIYRKSLFTNFEKHSNNLIKMDLDYLTSILPEARQVKIDIVDKDLKESGLRKLLNFGHTIGHAIECACEYQILHGKAVAIGILTECFIGFKRLILSEKNFKRICKAFEDFDLVFKLPKTINEESFFKALSKDKKNKNNQVHMVFLADIGKYYQVENQVTFSVTEEELKEAYIWMTRRFSC